MTGTLRYRRPGDLPNSRLAAIDAAFGTVGPAADQVGDQAAMGAAPADAASLNPCALVIDDEMLIADLWRMVLEEMGIPVCGVAATAVGAIELARQHRPKLVLMDMRLRQLDGVDAARAIYEMLGSNVIFISGSKDLLMKPRIDLHLPPGSVFKPVSKRKAKKTVPRATVPP